MRWRCFFLQLHFLSTQCTLHCVSEGINKLCGWFCPFFLFASAPFTNSLKDPHGRETAQTPAIKWFYSSVTREDHFSTPALTNCVTTTSRLFVLPALFCRFWLCFVTKHSTQLSGLLFFYFFSRLRLLVLFFHSCLFNTVTDCDALVSIKFRHCVFEKKRKGLRDFL